MWCAQLRVPQWNLAWCATARAAAAGGPAGRPCRSKWAALGLKHFHMVRATNCARRWGLVIIPVPPAPLWHSSPSTPYTRTRTHTHTQLCTYVHIHTHAHTIYTHAHTRTPVHQEPQRLLLQVPADDDVGVEALHRPHHAPQQRQLVLRMVRPCRRHGELCTRASNEPDRSRRSRRCSMQPDWQWGP